MRRVHFALVGTVCTALATGCGSPRLTEVAPSEAAKPDTVAYRFPIVAPPPLDNEISFYEQRVRNNPKGGLDRASLAAAYLAKARRSHDHDWLSRAEEAARASLELLSIHNTTAKLVLAKVAQEHHDFDTTLELAAEVLAERPGNESALALSTTSHLATGDVRAALTAADAWVDAQRNQSSLSHRAVVLAASGRDTEAEFDFHKALALEQPGELYASAWTRTMLGRFHQRRGNLDRARRAYVEAQRIQPDSVIALGALADFEARYGDHHEAERLYDLVYEQTGAAIWLAKKATAMKSHGHHRDARRLWSAAEEALRHDLATGHTGHGRDLANLLLDRGADRDVADALALARADAAIRRDTETVLTLSRALVRASMLDEANRAVRDAMAAGLQDARLCQRAAQIDRLAGRGDRADLHESRAQALNPNRQRDHIASARKPLAPAAVSVAVRAEPAATEGHHHHGPDGHSH